MQPSHVRERYAVDTSPDVIVCKTLRYTPRDVLVDTKSNRRAVLRSLFERDVEMTRNDSVHIALLLHHGLFDYFRQLDVAKSTSAFQMIPEADAQLLDLFHVEPTLYDYTKKRLRDNRKVTFGNRACWTQAQPPNTAYVVNEADYELNLLQNRSRFSTSRADQYEIPTDHHYVEVVVRDFDESTAAFDRAFLLTPPTSAGQEVHLSMTFLRCQGVFFLLCKDPDSSVSTAVFSLTIGRRDNPLRSVSHRHEYVVLQSYATRNGFVWIPVDLFYTRFF